MPPRIDSYAFGVIMIDGKTFHDDLIVCPDGVRPDWRRRQGHSLHPDDLSGVMGLKPEKIIIGRGSSGGMVVPRETLEWFSEKGIELIALPTKEACEKYNSLSARARVIAGLHLTC